MTGHQEELGGWIFFFPQQKMSVTVRDELAREAEAEKDCMQGPLHGQWVARQSQQLGMLWWRT